MTAVPGLRCLILGDGPESEATRAEVARLGIGDAVELRGKVTHEEVMVSLAGATCLLHPSTREGYGLVVVEAASLGTPAIVVDGPDNAAAELIEEGVERLRRSRRGSCDAGGAHRRVRSRAAQSCASPPCVWYEENREALSIESSLAAVQASYERSTA